MKVFIGGSKNQTKLTKKMTQQIDAYIGGDCSILIGDCYGIDLSVQRLLSERGYRQVTVYCSGDVPRNNVGGWSVVALKSDKRGYEFYRQKDIAMTADCDCGYMIWDGVSKGTRQNIEDLERAGKPVKVEPTDNTTMEFVDKKINDLLNEGLYPKIVKSFMGESAVESSMNRVQKHLDSDCGFFIISTHKLGMSEQDELDKVRELRVDLTGNNANERLGYIPLRGKYTREDNGEIEYEHSFFVPNQGQPNFKERALNLCKKYGQESILYSEKGKVYFLYQNGKMDFVGDHIRFVDEINKYWSRLKKGSHSKFRFAFESLCPINSLGLNAAHNWGELF